MSISEDSKKLLNEYSWQELDFINPYDCNRYHVTEHLYQLWKGLCEPLQMIILKISDITWRTKFFGKEVL